MFSRSLATLFAGALALSSTFNTLVSAVPLDGLDKTARKILERATPVAPHFVIYSDRFVSGTTGPPDVSEVEGYNVFALSFLLTEGAFDKAEEWTTLTASERSSVKAQYEAAGISLIVSLFGSTDAPTSDGADPTDTANTMAAWVIEYDLDGVDVDYEDFNAMNAQDGSAETWLTTFTTALRAQLPQGDYILTHAPVAPWFSGEIYASGAYLTVNENVGDLIDWYNVQFYNQGTTEYTTCAGLLTASSSTWPETALFQIAANGPELDKLVIGKPALASDASNGFMDTATLATCVEEAKDQGWDAGVMVWEYPDAASAWIEAVRADSWPVSGSGTSSSSVSPTSTSTSTSISTSTSTSTSASSTPTSGSCAGVAAWSSTVAYNGDSEVTYDGELWTSLYWSYNAVPGGTAGVWVADGTC